MVGVSLNYNESFGLMSLIESNISFMSTDSIILSSTEFIQLLSCLNFFMVLNDFTLQYIYILYFHLIIQNEARYNINDSSAVKIFKNSVVIKLCR